MGYIAYDKLRGRVRVTRRILSTRDERGYQTVLAHAGELLSLQEAYRRRVPEDALEPVGHAGRVAFGQLAADDGEVSWSRVTDADGDVLAEAEKAAQAAERAERRDTDVNRVDTAVARNAEEAGQEFPVHRGGSHWLLSDGSKFQGSRDEAETAEAALHDDEPDDDGDQDEGDGDA